MQNNGDESLILIDEEGEVIDDDDDDCQVIEDASGGAALRDLFVVDTNHIHEEHNVALVLGWVLQSELSFLRYEPATYSEHLEIHRIVMPTNGEEQQEASRSRKSGGSVCSATTVRRMSGFRCLASTVAEPTPSTNARNRKTSAESRRIVLRVTIATKGRE